MNIDEFAKFLIVNLPNFAGLVVAIVVLIWIVVKQQAQIAEKDRRIEELCAEDLKENPD